MHNTVKSFEQGE